MDTGIINIEQATFIDEAPVTVEVHREVRYDDVVLKAGALQDAIFNRAHFSCIATVDCEAGKGTPFKSHFSSVEQPSGRAFTAAHPVFAFSSRDSVNRKSKITSFCHLNTTLKSDLLAFHNLFPKSLSGKSMKTVGGGGSFAFKETGVRLGNGRVPITNRESWRLFLDSLLLGQGRFALPHTIGAFL